MSCDTDFSASGIEGKCAPDPYLLAGRADRLLKLHQHLLHPVDAELLGDLAYQPVETLAEWPESKNQLYALEEEFGPPDPGPWQNVDVLSHAYLMLWWRHSDFVAHVDKALTRCGLELREPYPHGQPIRIVDRTHSIGWFFNGLDELEIDNGTYVKPKPIRVRKPRAAKVIV